MNIIRKLLRWASFRAPDPGRILAREEWYQQHLGAVEEILHPIDSTMPHVDVDVVGPSTNRAWWTYVTGGMSDKAQIQSGDEPAARTELVFYSQDREEWVPELLQSMALYPFGFGVTLDVFHTVDIGVPVVDGSSLESMLVAPGNSSFPETAKFMVQGDEITLLNPSNRLVR